MLKKKGDQETITLAPAPTEAIHAHLLLFLPAHGGGPLTLTKVENLTLSAFLPKRQLMVSSKTVGYQNMVNRFCLLQDVMIMYEQYLASSKYWQL